MNFFFYIPGDLYPELCSKIVAVAYKMGPTQVIGSLEVEHMEGFSETKLKIRLSKDTKAFTQV